MVWFMGRGGGVFLGFLSLTQEMAKIKVAGPDFIKKKLI